jgi:purine-nucleoside phosphorylase
MDGPLHETIAFLKKNTSIAPEIVIQLGSGLGSIAEACTKVDAPIPYKDIPHFRTTGVRTHEGVAVFGIWNDRRVMALQGRVHLYEGYSPYEVAYPILVASQLGARTLIATNLSGGIAGSVRVGDFLAVTDHINLAGTNPLIGMHDDRGQVPFLDMTDAYDRQLIRSMQKAAARTKVSLKQGVLAYLSGPVLETPAELQFLKKAGVAAVGWSLIPEVIMARHARMRVCAVACISDITNPAAARPVNLDEIFSVGERSAARLSALLAEFLKIP